MSPPPPPPKRNVVSDAHILVLDRKFAKGWDGQGEWPADLCHPVLSSHEALTRRHPTDAHVVQYLVLEHGVPRRSVPRLNQGAIEALAKVGLAVRFQLIMVDVDCPAAHRGDVEVPQEWREAQADLVDEMPDWLRPHVAVYQTKKGYRLVVVLWRAVVLEEWTCLRDGLYAVCADVGIAFDPVHDWQRLFRAPFVVRDGVKQELPAKLDAVRRPLMDGRGEGMERLADIGRARPFRPAKKVKAEPTTRPLDFSAPARASMDLEDAKEAYRRDRTPDYTTFSRICPACKHKDCFGPVPGAAHKWLCFSTSHGADAPGVGHQTDTGWSGDIIDLDMHAEGKTLVELLKASGHLLDRRGTWSVAEAMGPEGLAEAKAYAADRRAEQRREEASEAGAPPSGEPKPLFERGSEVELAEKAAEAFRGADRTEMVHDEGSFWGWTGQLWQRIARRTVANRIASWDGALVEPPDDSPAKARALLISQRAIKGSIERLSELRGEDEWFKSAPDGVAFRNGFVRVDRTGQIVVEPLAPGQRQRAVLDCDYEPGVLPHKFLAHLEACWDGCEDLADRARFLGEFLGAALLGIATRYELAVVLLGSGANGKSTLLRPLRALFPSTAVGSVALSDWGREYNRAKLAGVRINIVTEMPETEVLNSEAVKSIISGEYIEARRPYEPPFDFRPIAAHIMAANELPPVRDTSPGMWRRLVVLTFGRKFDRDMAVIDYGAELAEEAGALAVWLIACASDLIQRGRYVIPASSEAEVARWRHEADNTSLWLSERCERTSVAITAAQVLYDDYRSWAANCGFRPVTITKWGRRMGDLGVERVRNDGARYPLALRKPGNGEGR